MAMTTDPGGITREIAELVETNQREPNPANAQRLIELRHAGFEEVRAGAAGELPSVGDVEPATGAVVAEDLVLDEMSAPALRRGLLRHGVATLPGLLRPDTTATLIDAIDHAFVGYDAREDGRADDVDPAWYTPFDPPGSKHMRRLRVWNRMGGGIWATDSPSTHDLLIRVMTDAGLVKLITDYFGERPAMSVDKSTLRRVPAGARTGDWHQDGAFIGEDIHSLNVWMCLSDCGVDAPGLDLVPTRMGLAETGTEGAHFDWAVSPDVVEQVRGDVGVIRPRFAPGDVVLFDHYHLHRTAAEPTMTADRYAIEAWFFAPSCYPSTQMPIVV